MTSRKEQETADYIMTKDSNIKIRRGKKSDCKEIRRLIQELADFEKMPDGPKISAEVLEEDGFVRNPPLYNIFVAEKPEQDSKQGTSELVGYALYYNKYSTWNGKAMILEDLYCSPNYRSKHVGSELFRAVVRESVSTGCKLMDFEVLEWNPAREFYKRLGAVDLTEKELWHKYRIDGEALHAAASIPN